MKIGILTIPLHTNYGGILQVYALQTVLKRLGHEVIVIDKSPYKYLKTFRKPFAYTKRFVMKFMFKKDIRIRSEEYHNEIYSVVSQYIQPFIDNNIQRVEIDDLKILKEKDFDAIVVGSDQIWRPKYYPKVENAYLDFTEKWNIKRITYAASFGTDKWEYSKKQTKRCGKLLKKFDAVSVREDSAIKLCNDYYDVNATQMLDPTMLLEVKDYIEIFEKSNVPKSKGTLLDYILDETDEIRSLIDKIAKRKGLIPFKVNSMVEDVNAPLEERIQPPVDQWLRGFYDAEFVVTDSFHACVFSILFNKPFIVVGNMERGLARFESFLKMFELEDRMITDLTNFDVSQMKSFKVEISEKRKEAIYFLKKNLS